MIGIVSAFCLCVQYATYPAALYNNCLADPAELSHDAPQVPGGRCQLRLISFYIKACDQCCALQLIGRSRIQVAARPRAPC